MVYNHLTYQYLFLSGGKHEKNTKKYKVKIIDDFLSYDRMMILIFSVKKINFL